MYHILQTKGTFKAGKRMGNKGAAVSCCQGQLAGANAFSAGSGVASQCRVLPFCSPKFASTSITPWTMLVIALPGQYVLPNISHFFCVVLYPQCRLRQ